MCLGGAGVAESDESPAQRRIRETYRIVRIERSEAATARGTNLAELQIEKSDLTIQLNFDQPMWVLAKDVSALYSSLVARMADFGVSTQAIRTDSGDGTLAGYNVNFWILQYGAIVRIRLDTVEVTCPNLAAVNIEQLDGAFHRLWEALVAAEPALSIRSSQVTLGIHGQPNGVDAREFLVRFVRATPTGLGENLGAGVVFYFGERPPLTFSSVSADLSGVYPGKMFVKLYAAFGGTMAPQSFRATTEDHFRAALAGIGLTLGENQVCS